jgi:hypothetical protein
VLRDIHSFRARMYYRLRTGVRGGCSVLSAFARLRGRLWRDLSCMNETPCRRNKRRQQQCVLIDIANFIAVVRGTVTMTEALHWTEHRAK